jgi:hypothetical protein
MLPAHQRFSLQAAVKKFPMDNFKLFTSTAMFPSGPWNIIKPKIKERVVMPLRNTTPNQDRRLLIAMR